MKISPQILTLETKSYSLTDFNEHNWYLMQTQKIFTNDIAHKTEMEKNML